MVWWQLALKISFVLGILYGIYYAWKEDYISWESIKYSLGLEGLKETLINIFSQPTFIFLYVVFVITPIWIIPDLLKLTWLTLSLTMRIMVSIAGIWVVNQIIIKKDL